MNDLDPGLDLHRLHAELQRELQRLVLIAGRAIRASTWLIVASLGQTAVLIWALWQLWRP